MAVPESDTAVSGVLMYCTHICPYCHMAQRLLEKKGVIVEKIFVDRESGRREEMIRRTDRTSVPQIFVGARHIGGYRELAQLDMAGELDDLLQQLPHRPDPA